MRWLYYVQNLKDKTLAGKKAIFDVNVLEASHRKLPEITDEFANNVRAGLTAETLEQEVRHPAAATRTAKDCLNAYNEITPFCLFSFL